MTSPAHEGLTLPTFHDAIKPYLESLNTIKKPGWLLHVEEAPDDLSRLASQMGGRLPFIPELDAWPGCTHCRRPLQFVWQIDFADFQPIAFAEQGLLQFFYCWHCTPEPEDDFGMQTRWYPGFRVEDARDIAMVDCPYLPEETTWAQRYAITPKPYLSLPSIFSPANPIPEGEIDRYIAADTGRVWNVFNATEGLHIWKEMWGRVGGFPPWVSFHDETPFCPTCSHLCEFVAAIGSEKSGIHWGGPGYWYFFACRRTDDCQGLSRPLMSCQRM